MCLRRGEQAGRRPTGAPGSRAFHCFDRIVAGAGGVFVVLVFLAVAVIFFIPLFIPLFIPVRFRRLLASILCRFSRHVPGFALAVSDGRGAAAKCIKRCRGPAGASLRLCTSRCKCRRSSFEPADGKRRAQRSPRQHFQIQFDAVRSVGKHAAPADHLYRLGSALHAAAWSGQRAAAPTGKFRAVISWGARRTPWQLKAAGKWQRAELMAGELGFEPRFSESESDVLPLNYSPNFCAFNYSVRPQCRRAQTVSSKTSHRAFQVFR